MKEAYKESTLEFLIDRMQNKHLDGFLLSHLVQDEILDINAVILRIISGITKITNVLKDYKIDLEFEIL